MNKSDIAVILLYTTVSQYHTRFELHRGAPGGVARQLAQADFPAEGGWPLAQRALAGGPRDTAFGQCTPRNVSLWRDARHDCLGNAAPPLQFNQATPQLPVDRLEISSVDVADSRCVTLALSLFQN